MSVSVAYLSQLKITEVLTDDSFASAAAGQVVHNAIVTQSTIDGTTDPAATKMAAFTQALTAGAATIDLTALVGTNGAAVDGTGLRVQAIKLKNGADNVMTLSIGASNGYDAWGASFEIEIDSGAEIMMLTADGGTDISGTNKTLDLAGTGTDEIEVSIVLG